MLFSIFFLLLAEEFRVEKEFPIGIKNIYFENLEYYSFQVDQTLMLASKTTAYQFDKQGNLLLQFGRAGNGPGEFMSVFQAYTDGTYFIIQDSARGDMSIFDSSGQFIARKVPRQADFYFLKNHAITTDTEEMLKEGTPLVPFEFTPDLEIKERSPGFHFTRPEIKKYHFDFSSFFLCEADGILYVMDETMPEVTTYDKNLKHLRTFRVNLPHYQPPGETWDLSKPRKQIVGTMRKYSWILRTAALKKGLVIFYSTPDPAEIGSKLFYLSVVGFDGKQISKTPLKVNGMFLGTVDDYIVVISEGDDLQYTLKYYKHHSN